MNNYYNYSYYCVKKRKKQAYYVRDNYISFRINLNNL